MYIYTICIYIQYIYIYIYIYTVIETIYKYTVSISIPNLSFDLILILGCPLQIFANNIAMVAISPSDYVVVCFAICVLL